MTRSGSAGMLRLWFPEQLDRRITLVKGDVADGESIRELISSHQPARIIHLSALQSPDCDADPIRGMEVNVGGTLNLLNAAADLGDRLERLVFASSAAVYGPRSLYPAATVAETEPSAPPNLYGVWKLAGENLARLFHEKTGVPTVCLRLNTTYGKGRDKGRTAAPTAAMKAVALGYAGGKAVPFRMPYFGRENYHYVADVGAHFAASALDAFAGFGAFNIRGKTVEVEEFLALVRTNGGRSWHVRFGGPGNRPRCRTCVLRLRSGRPRNPVRLPWITADAARRRDPALARDLPRHGAGRPALVGQPFLAAPRARCRMAR